MTAAELTCSKFTETAAGKTSGTQLKSTRHSFSAKLRSATTVFCEFLSMVKKINNSLNPEGLLVVFFPLMYKRAERKIISYRKINSSFPVWNYAEPHMHQTQKHNFQTFLSRVHQQHHPAQLRTWSVLKSLGKSWKEQDWSLETFCKYKNK